MDYTPFYGFYGTLGIGALAALNFSRNDYFSSLPKEVQEEINKHADEFHSEEEMHEFAENLIKTS